MRSVEYTAAQRALGRIRVLLDTPAQDRVRKGRREVEECDSGLEVGLEGATESEEGNWRRVFRETCNVL